jgi:hypothetical protein
MMDNVKTSRKIKSPAAAAGRVVLIYAVFAALWIFALPLPALLRETSQCGLVRAEFRRMTGPFGVLFKPTTAVVGFLAAGALEHEAPQTIGTPYAMLQFAPEIDAYDFRHAVEKGRMTIDSLNQFKHFSLRLFEVNLLKLLFHTSFLALIWIKELQMKLTFRWGFCTYVLQGCP